MAFISPTQFDDLTLGDEANAYLPGETDIRASVARIEHDVGRLVKGGKDYAQAYGSNFTRSLAVSELMTRAKNHTRALGYEVNAYYIALHRLMKKDGVASPLERVAMLDGFNEFCTIAEMRGVKLHTDIATFIESRRRDALHPRKPYTRPNPEGVEW